MCGRLYPQGTGDKLSQKELLMYSIDEIKERLEPIFKECLVEKAYLFGSYARGEADENSDIDIAFFTNPKNYDIVGVYSTICKMEDAFDISVDALTYHQIMEPKTPIGKRVKEEFLKDRVLIYEKKVI